MWKKGFKNNSTKEKVRAKPPCWREEEVGWDIASRLSSASRTIVLRLSLSSSSLPCFFFLSLLPAARCVLIASGSSVWEFLFRRMRSSRSRRRMLIGHFSCYEGERKRDTFHRVPPDFSSFAFLLPFDLTDSVPLERVGNGRGLERKKVYLSGFGSRSGVKKPTVGVRTPRE